MTSTQLIVSSAGGALVGGVVGGWFGRWTERERPVREEMIGATRAFTEAVSAGVAALTIRKPSEEARANATDKCTEAAGLLGRLHVLFANDTYEQAEGAVAALKAAATDESTATSADRRNLLRAYRHLRAFADCAGAEIRRPTGMTRWLFPSRRKARTRRRTNGEDPPKLLPDP